LAGVGCFADLLLTEGGANAADQAHANSENRQRQDGVLAQIQSSLSAQVRDPPKELANHLPYYIDSGADMPAADHEYLSAHNPILPQGTRPEKVLFLL
jgi:hypothetical protein